MAERAAPLVLRSARLLRADSSGRLSPGDPVDLRLRWGEVIGADSGLVPVRGEEVVDLDGRVLIPGLWDAHTHIGQWAQARRQPGVGAATSAAHAADLVAEHLAANPPVAGEIVLGFGLRDALWDSQDRALLDAAAPGVPVALASMDLHHGWLSSAALAAVGLPVQGDGVVTETAWFEVLPRLRSTPDRVLDAWVDEAGRAAAARGVVGVLDYEFDDNLAAWRRRVAAGQRWLRVGAGVWAEHLDGALATGLRTGEPVPGTDDLVSMGAVKVIIDGALNTRTAYCYEAYPGPHSTLSHGVLSVPEEELRALMAAATPQLECAVHAIGDAAVGIALDAFDQTDATGSIEHAQLMSPADLARMSRMGIVASVQPQHLVDDRDVADEVWAGRTDRAYVYHSLVEDSVRMRFGSDAPVSPLDPWLGVAAAVHRTTEGREPWHPEQRVSLRTALAASTQWGSGQLRVAADPFTHPVRPGRLAGLVAVDQQLEVQVGHTADLVVLDADPTTADLATLRAMPVAATLLAGRFTHRAL